MKISDFNSSPFELFSTTSSATSQVNSDPSIATLCGVRFKTDTGSEVMLVQNAGTQILPGVVVQGPAAQANSAGLSPATVLTTGYVTTAPIAAAIGGKVIQLASGATAVLANRFAMGYLNVVEGTGLGQTLRVSTNTAAATTSSFTVTLEDPFTIATDSTSRFTLSINAYGSQYGTDFTTDGVIISPATTLTGLVLGVSIYPIPATTATVLSYGFIQTKGLVACLGGDTTALGRDVMVPDSTAGRVISYAVANGTRVGVAHVVAAAGKYNMINVQL